MSEEPDPGEGMPAGWDEGGTAQGSPSFDYANLLRYDLQIRWTLYAATLPFLIPILELVCLGRRFDGDMFDLAGIYLIGLLTVGARRMLIRWGLFVVYVLYFMLQYRVFLAPGLNSEWPAAFYGFTAVGLLCVLCNLVATLLLMSLQRMDLPEVLYRQVGHILGNQNDLSKALDVYRVADQARANKAWNASAGRQD